RIESTPVWHIPIENGEDVLNFLEPPRTWLCLQQSLLNVQVTMEKNCCNDIKQDLDRVSNNRYEIENKPWPKYKEQKSVKKMWMTGGQLEKKKIYTEKKLKSNMKENNSVPWKKYQQSNHQEKKYIDDDNDDLQYIKSKKNKIKKVTDGKKRDQSGRHKVFLKVDKVFEE
ncbi:unnamed protein product, partial [Meganyctiphanes norvegica]